MPESIAIRFFRRHKVDWPKAKRGWPEPRTSEKHLSARKCRSVRAARSRAAISRGNACISSKEKRNPKKEAPAQADTLLRRLLATARSRASQAFCGAKPWRRANSLRPSKSNHRRVKRPTGAEPKKEAPAMQVLLFWWTITDLNR